MDCDLSALAKEFACGEGADVVTTPGEASLNATQCVVAEEAAAASPTVADADKSAYEDALANLEKPDTSEFADKTPELPPRSYRTVARSAKRQKITNSTCHVSNYFLSQINFFCAFILKY